MPNLCSWRPAPSGGASLWTFGVQWHTVWGAVPRAATRHADRRTQSTSPNQWRRQMAEPMPPAEGILLAHFIVSDDVERSRLFYTEVLGGRITFAGPPTYVQLANSWIIINVGG